MRRLLQVLALLAVVAAGGSTALAGHHHFHHHYARPQSFYSVGYRASYGYGGYGGCGPVGYAAPRVAIGYVRVPVVYRAPVAYRAPSVYRAPVAYRYGVGYPGAYRNVVSPYYRTGLYGGFGY